MILLLGGSLDSQSQLHRGWKIEGRLEGVESCCLMGAEFSLVLWGQSDGALLHGVAEILRLHWWNYWGSTSSWSSCPWRWLTDDCVSTWVVNVPSWRWECARDEGWRCPCVRDFWLLRVFSISRAWIFFFLAWAKSRQVLSPMSLYTSFSSFILFDSDILTGSLVLSWSIQYSSPKALQSRGTNMPAGIPPRAECK